MAIEDVYRGDTRVYRFTFVDENDAAIDITGWVVWFTAKANEADPDVAAAIQVTATAGGNALDSLAGGIMHLTLTSTDSDITPGNYHYDFQRVISSTPANVKTIEKGTFNILKSITLSN